MRLEIRNNNNEPIENLRKVYKFVKRVDPTAAIMPWNKSSENHIEELNNLPYYDEEYKEYFPKSQARGRFLSYSVAMRLEQPWGLITQAI